MDNVQKPACIFKALAADTRVLMMRLLKDHALCVGALSVRLGITQGAVSQHLRVLREAGLVKAERRGYYVHYRVQGKATLKLQKAIEGLFVRKRSSITRSSSKRGGRTCVRKKTEKVNAKSRKS